MVILNLARRIKRKLAKIKINNRAPAEISMSTLMATAAPPILKLEMGSRYIPKFNPSKPLGEDAHFVYSEKQVAGVADGVGSWAAKGIDAGDFARDLMRNCIDVSATAGVNPKRVLTEAHSRTTAAGTSTACVVSFDGEYLSAVNLGDSGFMIFRDGKFRCRSPFQQRRFNHPYQIGAGKRFNNTLGEAWTGKIRMAVGDIVVVGTDGLFDNVFVKEIEKLLAVEDTAEDLAVLLADLALLNSVDSKKTGPYALQARKAGHCHPGGKIDDITVIVLKFVHRVMNTPLCHKPGSEESFFKLPTLSVPCVDSVLST